ncbi:DUF6286 domain-containing protein [Streptomyces bohaiensis]|uniref:DUF6286 domain-containing protein n=1 Tax=Streptomyces bohaiensis TaxID=1431344 RepID=UPI003B7AC5D4
MTERDTTPEPGTGPTTGAATRPTGAGDGPDGRTERSTPPAASRGAGDEPAAGGPAHGPDDGTATGTDEPSHPARRFWSTRRLPAAALAVLLLAALGPLLYDIVAVRADRPASAWRTELADQLARRSLDDPWVVAVAAALVLVGLALVVAALTPGLRGLLPMRRSDPRVRPGIERNAAAQVVRDRAMGVAGVRSVRVRVGRSRVRVSARAHFRDLDEVRADLDGAMRLALAELDLAHRPALRVQVGRPAG